MDDGTETEQRMRVGILSDIHADVDPSTHRRWHNEFQPEGLEMRISAAVAAFEAARVDFVVLLGDITESGADGSFGRAFGPLARTTAPIAVLHGNHDLRSERSALRRAARAWGIRLLVDQPHTAGSISLEALDLDPAPGARQALPLESLSVSGRMRIVASHFPLLSQSRLLASAGLAYPGDLSGGSVIAAEVKQAPVPTLALCGHIHARTAATAGSLLQFTVGALIESPFDCTIVEIALSSTGEARVDRTVRRLGTRAALDPVFVADDGAWAWTGGQWVDIVSAADAGTISATSQAPLSHVAFVAHD